MSGVVTTCRSSLSAFYQGFLMARDNSVPRDFGVDLDKDEFVDRIVELFHGMFRDWSVDEMLLHPREALQLCDEFRRNNGFFHVPDDVILRWLLNRRKSPTA